MKRALVFVPHKPWPPKFGAHKRYLETIAGLKTLGFNITLASSDACSDSKWDTASEEGLKQEWVDEVHVHRPTIEDYKFVHRLKSFYDLDYSLIPVLRKLHLLDKRESSLSSRIHTVPTMRRWFKQLVEQTSPDLIFMNYAFWDPLVDHRKWQSITRIMETIDLLSLNRRMWQALEKHLPAPPINPADVADEVLQEDFFQKLKLTVDPEEFRIYDQYNYTIAISQQEAEIIEKNTSRTQVVHIPMTQEPVQMANDYSGPALFPTGPNHYNTQGYLYFAKRVLPHVRVKDPSFCLQVTGHCSSQVVPVEGVQLSGFVPNMESLYRSARFLVCPVFGGTGQQVKVVEAMAHGVPAVALRVAAARSPIQHEVNGLIADSAEEFAEHVLRLWKDPELCAQLGGAARNTIAQDFSRTRLIEALSMMVNV
ncbi:MAG: glycosyltransferase [Pyrinomonadaceae bacterium]|nr:glycosyltransferase [Pyrinomonadaceae bacterium]